MRHSLKINSLFAGVTALLVALLFLVNGIALLLSQRHFLEIDLTAGTVYRLSADTQAFIRALDRPVKIFVLSDEGGFSGSRELDHVRRIINQFPRFSGLITLEYVDYIANPAFAVNFPDLRLSHGDVIVQSGGNTRHVPAMTLFRYAQMRDGSLVIAASRAEEAITSAILNVLSDDMIRIAMLTGNGATENHVFNSILVDNNYEVHSVSLLTANLLEYDIAMLLLPTIDLSESVIRMLEAFLRNDGEYGKILFLTAGAQQGAMPNLDRFLSEWGIRFSNGAVFETRSIHTYQFQPFFPTAMYMSGRYADMLRDNSMPFLMPASRPMETLFTSRDSRFVETLLVFSETSGVRPADAASDFTADDAEIWGPMPALVKSSSNAVSGDGSLLQSHLIVSSSTGMLDPIALLNTSVTNVEYLLNLLGDLTDRDTINILPTSLARRTLGITSAQASVLGVVLVGVLPASILLMGVGVWLFRRFK